MEYIARPIGRKPISQCIVGSQGTLASLCISVINQPIYNTNFLGGVSCNMRMGAE